jgi:general secretion pathway protein H
VGELAATLREARSRARLQGEPVALILDLEARRFGIAGDGSSHPIDDDLALRLTTARLAGGGSPTAEVRFFPDGTASGGEIVVARGEARYTVRVEWLTGRVRVREGGDGPAD